MELFLLKVFAFLRPALFVHLDVSVFGLNIFEAAALVFIGMLFLATSIRVVSERALTLSAVDILIAAFILWCVAAYIAYRDQAELKELVRLVLPFITYTIAKNIIRSEQDYRQILLVMVAGFAVPVVWSAALIATGQGVWGVNYWTGIPRYEGVYYGPHTLAHNMAFLMMTMAVYVAFMRAAGQPVFKWKWLLFLVLGGLAAYCLYKSATRTAILGLIIFFAVYLFFYSKRLLVAGAVAGAILVLAFSSSMQNLFFDFQRVMEGQWNTEAIGSGRIGRWQEQWEVYSSLTFDQKLAGVGMGNQVSLSELRVGQAAVTDSHNDFLDVLVQTGAIGLLLFLSIYALLFKAVLSLQGPERYALLALLVAVVAMNFGSNSYVARFGLGQMLYLVLSYVELGPRRAIAQPASRRVLRREAAGEA